ncbi:MAG TPA: hypothetical protein VKT77_20350, partial [Chthonomonadaceae bacterium]|nr:hypothetical protein [Chthonomonadaceae bacterium]
MSYEMPRRRAAAVAWLAAAPAIALLVGRGMEPRRDPGHGFPPFLQRANFHEIAIARAAQGSVRPSRPGDAESVRAISLREG